MGATVGGEPAERLGPELALVLLGEHPECLAVRGRDVVKAQKADGATKTQHCFLGRLVLLGDETSDLTMRAPTYRREQACHRFERIDPDVESRPYTPDEIGQVVLNETQDPSKEL